MKYDGGKSKVAIDLSREIYPYINGTYCEPFVGGGSVAAEVARRCETPITMHLSDIHPDLIMLYQKVQTDGVDWLPDRVEIDEYVALKKSEPSALRGFVGFTTSFSGKWFASFMRGGGGTRNYCAEAKRNINAQFELFANHRVIFTCCDYQDAPQASVTYCDPPYKATTGYTIAFDHNRYYEWLMARKQAGSLMLCSEYHQEIGSLIWKRETITYVSRLGHTVKKTDKLYKV